MDRLESATHRLDRKNSKFKEIYQTKYLGEKERLKVEKVYKFFRNYLSNINKKDLHDQIMKKMKSKNKSKILRLFRYAESINSNLSDKILDINSSIINNDQLDSGESISVDLVELASLVDPDFVNHDLKIDTFFVE